MYVFSFLIDEETRQTLIQLLGDLTKTQRKRRRGQKSLRCDIICCRSRPQQKSPYTRAKTKNCKHSSSNVNMANFRELRETCKLKLN